jgi:hypothetical protein
MYGISSIAVKNLQSQVGKTAIKPFDIQAIKLVFLYKIFVFE